jgi:hypothetical protein
MITLIAMIGIVGAEAASIAEVPVAVYVLGAIALAVPSLLSYLAKRSIDGFDRSITALTGEVKLLGSKDTDRRVEITELKGLITALEDRVSKLEAGKK